MEEFAAGSSRQSPNEGVRREVSRAVVRPVEDGERDEGDHWGSALVLRESSPARRLWTLLVTVLLVYTATVFLYRLCFCMFHIDEDGPDPVGVDDVGWQIAERAVSYLFMADLLVNFFLSYQDRSGTEIDDLRLIAKRYLTGFFWVDLLACIPEEAIEAVLDRAVGNNANRVARVSRMQRMSRLARLVRLTRLAKLFNLSNPWWRWLQSFRGVRVVNFIVGLGWSLHLLACFWYLTAALHDDPKATWVGRRTVDVDGTSLLTKSPFEQWLVAMYFIMTVFTTVGFGDISAGTEAEIVYVAFTMLVGAVVHGIIMSRVIQTVTSTDQVDELVDRKNSLVDAFADHAEIPEALRSRLKEEIRMRAKTRAFAQSFNQDEMAELIMGKILPRSLIGDMAQNVFESGLHQNGFLRCCYGVSHIPPRLPLLLACYLAKIRFEAGEIVYQWQDFPFNLFLVLNGTFSFIGRPGPKGGKDEMLPDMKAVQTVTSIAEPPKKEVSNMTTTWYEVNSDGERLQPESSELFPYKLLSYNTYFGEFELASGSLRMATTRCEKSGTALVLHKSDYFRFRDQFPQFHKAWVIAAHKREWRRTKARQRLVTGLPMRHLAAKQIQDYIRSRQNPETGSVQRGPSGDAFYNATLQYCNTHTSSGSRAMNTDENSEQTRSYLEVMRMELRQCMRSMEARVDSMQKELRAVRQEVREIAQGGAANNGADCELSL